MRLYLDASAIIYGVEGTASARALVAQRLAVAQSTGAGSVVTSLISRVECRVKPLRDGRADLLSQYDLFLSSPSLRVAGISVQVVDRATELRAQHRFKTPDAVHVATAIEERCDLLLTGDVTMERCSEIRVEVIRP